MLQAMPELGNPFRLAQLGKAFAGKLALSGCPRLADLLAEADASAEAHYSIAFGRGEDARPEVRGEVQARLPLICQRCLGRFEFPIRREWWLTLIQDPAEEKLLPAQRNAYLLTEDEMRLRDFVEDELILALPLVPRHPDGADCRMFDVGQAATEKQHNPNPFASLEALKKKH